MTVKKSVLKVLEENRDESISGEELAKELGVSRTAIWKAIKSLRAEGYNINAGTNKGYNLTSDNDLLSQEGIRLYLRKEYKENIIKVYKTIDSTNKEAKKILVDEDVPHGTVLIAEEQTEGKGRFKRKFYSPNKNGIYMSVILRPNIELSKAVHITTTSAVAVCKSIEKLIGKYPKIKWVNDIFLNDKKICGILTEATGNFESGNIENIVVGIGINFKNESELPSEIKDIAGSLFKCDEQSITRNQLVGEIVNELLSMCDNLDDENIMKEYKELSFVLGRDVTYVKNNKINKGKAIDIKDDGTLIVKLDNSEIDYLNSGEISLKEYK